MLSSLSCHLQRELETFREEWRLELRQKRSPVRKVNDNRFWQVMAIWTLPDDVMCEIFHAAAELEPPRRASVLRAWPELDTSRMEHLIALGWIRLTHVCQNWRAILLSMTDLWGRVAFTFTSRSAFPTLFVRAGGAPVDIDAPLDEEKWPRCEALISLPLARSLRINSRVTPRLHAFLTLNSESMSWLRDLRMVLPYDKEADLELAQRNITIDAPRLECASFKFCRGSSITLSFTTTMLRHLEVRAEYSVRNGSHITGNYAWIIALLRTSPLLENLSIVINPGESVVDWDSLLHGTSLQLAKLRTIKLEDSSYSHLIPLMKHIRAAGPPSSLSASFGTYLGEPVARLLWQQYISRVAEYTRGFVGYLGRIDHNAFFLGATKGTKRLSIRSLPNSDVDPADLANTLHDQDVDRALAIEELVNMVSLNVTDIEYRPPRDPRPDYEWFSTLADSIPNKDRIEQLFLRVELNQDYVWSSRCRERLLRPMTAVRTLCLLPCMSQSSCIEQLVLCHMDPTFFPALQTLIVRLEMSTHFEDHARLGE
ncbi:unnamed protein product [Peniophora sp. CBMAI 1063]|nr:unnamed protein product [Peniophora sp. CBMAI 1063]